MDRNIAIIGGGVSGLFAALELIIAGCTNLTVYEASDRLGGRIHSVASPSNTGKRIDLGAHWIHGRGGNPVWRYVKEENIAFSEEGSGDADGQYLLPGGKPVDEKIFELTEKVLEKIYDELEELTSEDVGFKSVGEYFDQKFGEYLLSKENNIKRIGTMKLIYHWYTLCDIADSGTGDMRKQSVSSWSEYIDHSMEGLDYEPVLENGYQVLIEHLLNKLEGKVNLKLNSKLTKIYWNQTPVVLEVLHNDVLERFEVDETILSVSLGVLKKHHVDLFEPSLPEHKKTAIHEMGFGLMNKIFLHYSTPFWSKDIGGVQFIHKTQQQDETVDKNNTSNDHIFQSIAGFDTVSGQPNLLCGMIAGEKAELMEGLDDDVIASECHKLLIKHLGKEIAAPSNVTVTRWKSKENILGSYSYRTPHCDRLMIGPWTLASPLKDSTGVTKVRFCGEGTDMRGYGTVHGAMRSGIREANLLIHQLKENNKS